MKTLEELQADKKIVALAKELDKIENNLLPLTAYVLVKADKLIEAGYGNIDDFKKEVVKTYLTKGLSETIKMLVHEE